MSSKRRVRNYPKNYRVMPMTAPKKGDKLYKRNEIGQIEYDGICEESEQEKKSAYYEKIANEILKRGVKCI